jgi:hypothetical protein
MSEIKTGYTRVTAILDPFSGLSKVDPMILKKAGTRGTIIHQVCDAMIKKVGVLPYPALYEPYIESFKLWAQDKIIKPSPGRIYYDPLKLTGEIDALIPMDGNSESWTLIDFKTSSKEGKTWYLQGSAYAHMLRAEGYSIGEIQFVHLSKTGKEPKIYTYREDWDKFLTCYHMYNEFFKTNLTSEEFYD